MIKKFYRLLNRRLRIFSSSVVIVDFPAYVKNYMKRKESSKLGDFLSLPVVNSVIGGSMTIAGGAFSTWLLTLDERIKTKNKEEQLFKRKCDFLKNFIASSERNLIHSRESFVRGLGKDVIDNALQNSRRKAQDALDMHKTFSDDEKVRFMSESGYDQNSIINLISHIDYHLGSLLLKEREVSQAKLELARSLADRISVSDNKQYYRNEINRTRIKIADSMSQCRELSFALRLYDDICEPMKNSYLLTTFWKTRALNNRAIVLYAIGQDNEALLSMEKTTSIISEYFRSIFFTKLTQEDIDSVVFDVQKLKQFLYEGKKDEGTPSPKFCEFVFKGMVDSVDILHLPFIKGIIDAEKVDDNWLNQCFNKENVAIFAYECLERVRLLLRKQCTASANSVVMLSCPYSHIQFTPNKLAGLLHELFELPFVDNLYVELDATWVRQEGSLRMKSAILSGMISLFDAELQNPQKNSSMKTEEWIKFLDKSSESLLKLSKSYSNPVPVVHAYFARFIRARVLILLGRTEDAKKELEKIREWTLVEQRAIKKRLDCAREDGLMFPDAGVPPRHARLQISSLVMLMSLQLEECSLTKNALQFALESFHMESDNHPLMVAANKVLTDKKEAMCWLFGKSKGGLSHSINHCYDQFEKTAPFDYNALLKSSRKCYKKWELLSRNPAED